MRIPRIYLETSVFNFAFADDAPDKKSDTLKLFEEIKAGKYQTFTSVYVTDELNLASEPKRSTMLDLIKQCKVEILSEDLEADRLAYAYVSEGIIPGKYLSDAKHIAVASVTGLDVIVSWNFEHIVKLKTIRMTEVVNLKESYRRILINSPTEVIDND